MLKVILLDPLSHLIILILLSFFGRVLKRKKIMKRFLFLSVLYLLLLISPFPAIAYHYLENLAPPQEIPSDVDTAVVLSGGTIHFDQSSERMLWLNNSHRIMEAIRLYRQGKVKKILLSGFDPAQKENYLDEVSSMRVLAKEFDIPATNLLLEPGSTNTAMQARKARGLASLNQTKRIVLITSSSHMYRSKLSFEKQGFEVFAYPTNYAITQGVWTFNKSIMLRQIYYEFLGLAYYKLTGKI